MMPATGDRAMDNRLAKIGSIKHNDWTRTDRVSLYRAADGRVWAAARDEDPYPTEVPFDRAATAWDGPEWDLRLV